MKILNCYIGLDNEQINETFDGDVSEEKMTLIAFGHLWSPSLSSVSVSQVQVLICSLRSIQLCVCLPESTLSRILHEKVH